VKKTERRTLRDCRPVPNRSGRKADSSVVKPKGISVGDATHLKPSPQAFRGHHRQKELLHLRGRTLFSFGKRHGRPQIIVAGLGIHGAKTEHAGLLAADLRKGKAGRMTPRRRCWTHAVKRDGGSPLKHESRSGNGCFFFCHVGVLVFLRSTCFFYVHRYFARTHWVRH